MRFEPGQNFFDFLSGKVKKLNKYSLRFVPYDGKNLPVVSKPYTPPRSTYKKLVSTQGFGCSGSGALIDLFAEFDNFTVYGAADERGGSELANDNSIPKIEVDFLRRYGGVFDLELNFHINDENSNMRIQKFIHYMEFLYSRENIPLYNDKFMELTREFVENLTDTKYQVKRAFPGNEAFKFGHKTVNEVNYANLENPYIFDNRKRPKFEYILKKLSVDEFRSYAHEYLVKFFNTIESKEYLFLDFLLCAKTPDFEKYKQYVGDYKLIAVYRDPRDVFVEGIIANETWIPSDKENFVKWYKSQNVDLYINANHPNCLTLRFEDLVLNYDVSVGQIIDFLETEQVHHINPKKYFKPEYSIRNIGLYKNWQDQESVKYIEENLKEYCYYKD